MLQPFSLLLLLLLKIYCLGESRAVQAHIQLEKGESGSKPVRGEVTLPKQISSSEAAADGSSSSGSADKSIILVFAKAGPHATLAKQLGAHIVGAEDLIADVLSGNVVKFDKVLSTKEMFPHVIKIAKLLGPKGLMPSPARGTVSDDIETMMASLKASTKYEMDEDGFIHLGKKMRRAER